jgi:hypothetical protein
MDSINCNSSAGVMRDMGWPVEGVFVALKVLTGTESDSISSHYVAQVVALASHSACNRAFFVALLSIYRRKFCGE